MGEILVLAEHRRGEIRDVTWEMLARGRELAKTLDAEINVALLGKGVGHFAEALARNSNKVFLIDDARLEIFNSETYQAVIGTPADRKTTPPDVDQPFLHGHGSGSEPGCPSQDASRNGLHRD